MVIRLLALIFGICLSDCWGAIPDSPCGGDRLFSPPHEPAGVSQGKSCAFRTLSVSLERNVQLFP